MTNELITELEKLFQDYGVPALGRGRRLRDPVKSRILMLMQRGVSSNAFNRANGISVMTLGSWKEKSKSMPTPNIYSGIGQLTFCLHRLRFSTNDTGNKRGGKVRPDLACYLC